MTHGGDNVLCGNCLMRRILAGFIICIGIILLICFMPYWMWLALLGVALIAGGCFILIRKIC